jgi:hypothetical protein
VRRTGTPKEVKTVARNGLFSRRGDNEERTTRVVDRDGVVETVEPSDAPARDRDRDGVDDRTEVRESRTTSDADDETGRFGRHSAVYSGERVVDHDRDGVDDRVEAQRGAATVPPVAPQTAPVSPAPTRVVGGRTSFFVTLGLIVGTAAPLAALTGRLAPVGLALGVLGVLLALGGLASTSRPNISGRGVGMLALLLAVGGIVLAILAMNHSVPWLDSRVDEVARLRQWLDARMPWMSDW